MSFPALASSLISMRIVPSTAPSPELGKVTLERTRSALPSVNRREEERTRRKSIAISEEVSICSGVGFRSGFSSSGRM